MRSRGKAEEGRERFALDLIGPFALSTPEGPLVPVTSRKGRALLALLALAPGGARGRIWLQGMLWGSRFREQAQASLRRELASLCAALDRHGAGALLERSQNAVALDLDAVDVDVLSLGPGLARGPSSREGVFLEDVDLPGCGEFTDWLESQRRRVRDLQAAIVPQAPPPPTAEQVTGGILPPVSDLLDRRPPDLPPKPSVCVLPFAVIGRDADPLLGQGLAEELGVTLARFPSLFVVATPASPDPCAEGLPTEVARRFGVAYLVAGTAALEGSRVRTSLRLIDGGTGRQIWADSRDGSLDAIFALQRSIVEAVAPRIHTEIDLSELRGALSDPLRTADAYALYWRANALFRHWTRDAVTEAQTICERLVAMQPSGSWAAAMAAFCHAIAFASGWTDDPAETRRTAVRHYQQAMRHGGEDASVLGYAAGTLICIGGDLEVAERLVAHALSLVPSYQPTLFWGGWVDLASGRPERARERFELSLRINPAAGVRAYAMTGIGVSFLMDARFEEAYAFLRDATQFIPDYPVTLVGHCVAAALSGRREEAREVAALVRGSGALDVVTRVFAAPAHRHLIQAGLELAESG